MAAMNVTDGQIPRKIITRNDSATFTAFLTEIDQAIPPHLGIHLVMDNGSSHTSKATRAWLCHPFPLPGHLHAQAHQLAEHGSPS